MIDLLKTDLKRALKDKLFIVLLIIGGAFAVATPLLYKVIFLFIGLDPEMLESLELFGLQINAKTMFFTSFSLSNNFGMILPIFIAIILCKDFGSGTIRNKIISGKSRTSIYFSLLITCVILTCAFIFAHAILTLLISLIFFEYQATPFTASDFGYFMASIGLELLVYIFVCALLTFFIVYMKNAGLSIVMYFVVSFVLMIVGSITLTAGMLSDPTELSYKVLEFLNTTNVFSTTVIGTGVTYTLKQVLHLVIPNGVMSIVLILLGLLIFKKKDLK